jgi:hypothetical protein
LLGLVALSFICFTGNFLFFQDFGLYEDDYVIALSPSARPFSTELSYTPALLKSPPQGRPLLWTLNNLGFNILWKGNSLSIPYLFVAFLTSLNAFLLFVLLRRHVPQTIALAACVLLLLYPADTSKQQLMHWPAHLVCCAVVLASLYAHLHAGRIASWIIPSLGAAFCILCYEPYFLLFFAFPFYRTYRQSFQDIRPFLFWIPYLLLLFVITMLWRQSLGGARVADLSANLAHYLQRALIAPLHGGTTVASAMWERPWDVLRHAGADLWALGLVLFVPAYFAAQSVLLRSGSADPAAKPGAQQRPRQLLFLAAAGLVTFLVSYPYRFIDHYYPPNVDMGRFSGMHAVGAFGLCIFLAALGTFVYRYTQTRQRVLYYGRAAVGAYLLLLFMFSVQFQKDQYVRSWAEQKAFWNEIADLSPDMAEVDAVLLNTLAADPRDALPHTEAFTFTQWDHQSGSALPHFFDVKTAAGFPKLLHLGQSASILEEGEEGVRLITNSWREQSFWPLIRDRAFIELRFEDGQWRRQTGPLVLAGRPYMPKLLSKSPGSAPLSYTALGRAVLVPDSRSELRWDYQRIGRVYPKS